MSQCGECVGHNLSNRVLCSIVYVVIFKGVGWRLLTFIVYAEQLVLLFPTSHNNGHLKSYEYMERMMAVSELAKLFLLTQFFT